MNKTLVAFVILSLICVSLLPVWVDPFHQKDYLVTFWEWAIKEIWELIYGEVPVVALFSNFFSNFRVF